MNDVYSDPEEMFHHTLNVLSDAPYDIHWEDQGAIINQNHLSLNWNPLDNAERFKQGATTIIFDQDQSDQQAAVISAILDNHTSKEVLFDQLKNQMKTIRTEIPIVHKSVDQQLSQAEKEKMNNEITSFIDQADRKLLTWLDTSNVHSTMKLWVDRSTERPIRVTFITSINYMNNNQFLEESITDSFLINDVE